MSELKQNNGYFFFVSLSFQQHSHTRRIQGWKVIYIQFVLIHKALNTTLLLTHLTSQCDTQWYPLTFMSSAPGKNSYLSNYWGPSFTTAYWVLVLQHKNEWVSIGAAVQVSWSQPEQKGKKNPWSSLDKLWDLFQSDFPHPARLHLRGFLHRPKTSLNPRSKH